MDEHRKNEIKKGIIKKSYIVISLIVAFITSSGLWYWNISPQWKEGYVGYIALFGTGLMFCIVYWFFAKMYHAHKIGLYRLTDLLYFQVLSFGFADAILFVEMVVWSHGFNGIKIETFVIMLVLQVIITVINIFIHNRFFARYDEPKKIVIVYGKEDYRKLVRKMDAKRPRYQILDCIEEAASMESLQKCIQKCDNVYLYEVNDRIRNKLILYCDSIGKVIYSTQSVDEFFRMGFDISRTFDTPFIRTKREATAWYYPFVKRTFDIVCSGLACIILLPLFIIVAAAIKLHDGGPVFYKQERVTKDHKKFMIYKFRSMITDAEADGMKRATDHDDRITPVGRIIRATRIDELPQLINILKGEMSIVGPRPERVELDDAYTKQIPEFGLRLKVPAGLTGYAQVFGKYNTTPEDKLKMDLLYINQRSLMMDFKLILYTVKIMFIPESTEGFDEDAVTLEDIERNS